MTAKRPSATLAPIHTLPVPMNAEIEEPHINAIVIKMFFVFTLIL